MVNLSVYVWQHYLTRYFLSGLQLKQEKQAKLKELAKVKEEAEKIRTEKEALKKDAEDLENVALDYYRKLEEENKKKKADEDEAKNKAESKETFERFDSNQDGLLDVSEMQPRKIFDKDGDGLGKYIITYKKTFKNIS